jgi:hypothetical protein
VLTLRTDSLTGCDRLTTSAAIHSRYLVAFKDYYAKRLSGVHRNSNFIGKDSASYAGAEFWPGLPFPSHLGRSWQQGN